MTISFQWFIRSVSVFALLLVVAGCATSPKRLEPSTATTADERLAGQLLQEMDVVEQPELEADWADWVKDRYPNWRAHYWVDRGQWGNRGYIVGKAPSGEEPLVETEFTPLPPAPSSESLPPVVIEPATEPLVSEPAPPTTYTVVKGDSLWKIAGRVYGNPLKWPRIYRANQDKIKNPHKIYPGQVFTIPRD